jgi:murein DD-endopeptidase MepM/ murein hydrolase activator NlpD
MAKKKFRFNSETLNYEQIEHTIAYKIKRFLIHVSSGVFSGFVFFVLFLLYVDSPKEKQFKQQIEQMEAQYNVLEHQFNELQVVMSDLQERDDNLYRVILQADPIPLALRRSTSANIDYYEDLLAKTNTQIIASTSRQMDELSKQVYIQSKSYDELAKLVTERENLLEHIPAIQPVLNRDLTRTASGYGWRIHPIYNIKKFHHGMDFTAPVGTDVFATGKGVVKKAGWEQGYGQTVIINHGFGYETLYAHLNKALVRPGQQVNRGEIIGLVGNSGRSTGPHLHYEVHLKGVPQNPQNFYFLDLSPEEYDRMVQLSNNAGAMYD